MRQALLLWAALAVSAAGSPCIEVAGAWVVAADLSPAVPELRNAKPETRLMPSPAPGISRTLRSAEWTSIARLTGLVVDGPELCITLKTRRISEQEWQEAVARGVAALAPDAEWKIIATSQAEVPSGVLELSARGLSQIGEGRYLWHGTVRGSQDRRSPIWVRFECRFHEHILVAARDLAAGEALRMSDLEPATRPGNLLRPSLPDAKSLAGTVLRRSVRMGSALTAADLAQPLAIRRGQSVLVTVRGHGAELRLEASALQEGRLGDSIYLENPAGRRRFRAAVTGKGEAVVEPTVKETN